MNFYYNLPQHQRATQRSIDEFNEAEKRWWELKKKIKNLLDFKDLQSTAKSIGKLNRTVKPTSKPKRKIGFHS